MPIVIVAIPSPHDYVWEVSSEKVPHVTLCYLGDDLNVARTELFLDHLVKTSARPFALEVGQRGVLGDKSADVLYFGKYGMKDLDNLRAQLLANEDIAKAYASVEQFETWTPHLTLGYPESPAHVPPSKWPSDIMGLVDFNRIALWTSDYEGVEFPLTKNVTASELQMSEKGKEFLEHHGVKGMKWGVVRDRVKGNAAVKLASASEDHKRAQSVRTKAKVVGVHALTNKDLQTVITRMNLEINYKNLKTVEHEQSLVGMGKKWAAKVVTDALVDGLSSWIKRPGSSASSSRKTSRGKAWVGQQPSMGGTHVPAAIGS